MEDQTALSPAERAAGYPEAYEPNMMDVPLDDIPRLLPRMYVWGQAAFGLTLDGFREDPLAQSAE